MPSAFLACKACLNLIEIIYICSPNLNKES